MMKKLILLFLSFLVTSLSFSQELKEKKEDLDFMFKAEYHVLKSDKKIKEGLYSVFNKRNNKVIARGNYKDNHQVGTWLFFDVNGDLEQRYDFDNAKLTYHRNIIDSSKVKYSFPFEYTKKDTVTAPIKVGAYTYGCSAFYYPLINIDSKFNDSFQAKHVIKNYLNINKDGNLISWVAIVDDEKNSYEQDLNLISPIFKLFIPAQLNHVNVPSTMVITINLSISARKETRTTITYK